MTKFERLIEILGDAAGDNPVAEQSRAIENAIEILQTLDSWCDAYPEHVFIPMTKTDWEDHHRLLKHARRSGSAAAADCMRHVVNGFKKVLHQ